MKSIFENFEITGVKTGGNQAEKPNMSEIDESH